MTAVRDTRLTKNAGTSQSDLSRRSRHGAGLYGYGYYTPETKLPSSNRFQAVRSDVTPSGQTRGSTCTGLL